jgi:hypothetical protein
MNVLRDVHGHASAGIRPEHVELGDGDPAGAHRVGRVSRCVFLGSITRVTLVIDGQDLLVELSGRRDDLAPGVEVAVRLPAHALVRLDETP